MEDPTATAPLGIQQKRASKNTIFVVFFVHSFFFAPGRYRAVVVSVVAFFFWLWNRPAVCTWKSMRVVNVLEEGRPILFLCDVFVKPCFVLFCRVLLGCLFVLLGLCEGFQRRGGVL